MKHFNYQRVYDALIERAKGRVLGGYGEWHHIHPRSMGGSDDKSNLVKLTAREHFVVHHLLWRIHGDGPMGYAFSMMVYGGNKKRKHKLDYKVTSRHFESARKAASEAKKGKKRKPFTDITKYRMMVSHTGKYKLISDYEVLTEEMRQQIILARRTL